MRQGLYLSRLVPAALGLPLLLAAAPALAWTPRTQGAIAREAARLAPPDLARQIEKHEEAFQAGVQAPFQDADADRHRKDPDGLDPNGSGTLDQALFAEVDGAISAIRLHRPFEEVVLRLGKVAHYVADANNPLAVSGADPEESRYFVDYLRYAETAEPRFPLVFYGVPPSLDRQKNVKSLLAETFRRGRAVYPMVGREYRKIGFASGIGRFDDRSTAFGVASVAFSHAVTDVTLVLRYIWIAAGGADNRASMVNAGTRLLILPRADRGR
ncbi:MAG: hypothetical protein ACJ759_19530 [Thermoanaerobaculia bacterium]